VEPTITAKDGKLYSDWVQPINRWSNAENSIHNDDVARGIGMRGGTIPGTVHLNHFVPIIMQRWGRRWFEQGSISIYYTFATTDREPVRAVMAERPAANDMKVDAWVENPEGKIVAKGTLSVGSPAEPNYVRSLQLQDARRDELRILEQLSKGQSSPSTDDAEITSGDGEGAYAGILIHPTAMYGLLNVGFHRETIRRAVGFFGATEINIKHGPIKLNRKYRRSGEVVCVGASPKTEFAWVDSRIVDPDSGAVVAEMRHMTRWMKVSSTRWKE
jgi:hypothetical protein